MFVGEGVEGDDGGFACGGFARGYEDFGTACLEKTIGFISWWKGEKGKGGWYPDAAWRPRPRDPPLTTATLPLRLKMLEKSWSWTSASAEDMAVIVREWSSLAKVK